MLPGLSLLPGLTSLPGITGSAGPSSSDATSSATSGGPLYLGGNPNLAMLSGQGSVTPWLVAATAAVALVVVWKWRR